MPSHGVFALALHHFPVLEGLKNLLEKGGKLSSRRRAKIASRGTLPPPSCTTKSRGEEALGGFSLKEGAPPSEVE